MIRTIKDFVEWALFYSRALTWAEYKDVLALEREPIKLPAPPTMVLVLSPRDAAMFVEHIARQRAEIETAKVFDGPGASGDRKEPYQLAPVQGAPAEQPGPVAPGSQ